MPSNTNGEILYVCDSAYRQTHKHTYTQLKLSYLFVIFVFFFAFGFCCSAKSINFSNCKLQIFVYAMDSCYCFILKIKKINTCLYLDAGYID